MQKLKVNDEVVVLAGKDKGKTGKVAKINFKKKVVSCKVLILLKKLLSQLKKTQLVDLLILKAPLHISNVAVVSPKTKKATRVRIEKKDGKKS